MDGPGIDLDQRGTDNREMRSRNHLPRLIGIKSLLTR
jgi:hypothetical protein